MLLIWPAGGSAMSEANAWILPVLSLAGGLLGGIFGSFFAKRGEIAAIHSQLGKVVHQNEQIVNSTEKIKDEIYGRQRLWELKVAAAHDVMKTIGAIHHTLIRLQVDYNSRIEHAGNLEFLEVMDSEVDKLIKRNNEESEKLWEMNGILMLHFDGAIVTLLNNVGMAADKLSSKQGSKESDGKNLKAWDDFFDARIALAHLLKCDLADRENVKADD